MVQKLISKKPTLKFCLHIILLLLVLLVSAQNNSNIDKMIMRLNALKNTDPDETIKIATFILKHSSSDRQKSNTLALMSFAYFSKKDIKKSTELLFQAKEIAEDTNDPEIIAKIYGTIAQMYLNIGFKDKAVDYLHKAIGKIEILPEENDKYRLKGLSYIELGKIHLDEKKYNLANTYFKNSLTEFKKMDAKSLYFIKRSYFNIGDSFYEMNTLDSAQWYLKKALEIKQNPNVNPYALFTLSNIYTEKKQYQRAIDTLSSILNRNELKDDLLQSEIYLSISKNYYALDNAEQFNWYNGKHLALNKEITDNNLSTIKNAVNLEEKNLTNEITYAHQQNNRLLLVILVISCIGTVVLLYVRQKKKTLKKQYESIIELLEKKAEPIDFPKAALPIKEVGSKVISPETEQVILEKLIKFEQSDKFTNSKLNIATVAIQLKTNTTYLSQIINKYKGKNFSAYINELRINYICEKIHTSPEYLTYKISFLGELAGFTSHSTFTTIFKNVTGISPSIFINETEKINKEKTIV